MIHNHTTIAPIAQRAKSAAPRRAEPAQDWQANAVANYGESRLYSANALPADMSARIYALTGRRLAPEAVYVDYDNIFAIATVEGRVFKLRPGKLVLLRACAVCGAGHFESPAIASQIDLGYALGKWEPRCASCQEEDVLGWLDHIDL